MRPSRARSVRPIRGATRRRKAPVAPPSFGYSIQVACPATWCGIISSFPASLRLATIASPGAARRAGNGRPRADPSRRALPLLRGGRRTALASGLITRLIGRGLSPLYSIVDQAAGEPCSRADAGAKPGIPGDGANDRAASGADRRPGKSALLRRVHVRAARERDRAYGRRKD